MTVPTYNIEITQGDTFSQSLYQRPTGGTAPIDMTGYTARMQVRKTAISSTVIIELSTTNGGITIGVDNKVVLSISATDTAAIRAGDYVYDLKMTVGGNTTTWLAGAFTVVAEVTR